MPTKDDCDHCENTHCRCRWCRGSNDECTDCMFTESPGCPLKPDKEKIAMVNKLFDEDDMEDTLRDLEPGDSRDPLYNPLNYAYPMAIETGLPQPIEIMVKFLPIQGKDNIPVDLIGESDIFRVPVSIEDVLIDAEDSHQDEFDEQVLQDEMQTDQSWYLIPTIVYARWLFGSLADYIPGSRQIDTDCEPGEGTLTREEVAELIPAATLLERIKQYREEVANDPNAPSGLLDLLNHFSGHAVEDKDMDDWQEDSDADYDD